MTYLLNLLSHMLYMQINMKEAITSSENRCGNSNGVPSIGITCFENGNIKN